VRIQMLINSFVILPVILIGAIIAMIALILGTIWDVKLYKNPKTRHLVLHTKKVKSEQDIWIFYLNQNINELLLYLAGFLTSITLMLIIGFLL